MYLTHRPTTVDDLTACLPLIRDGFVFDRAERGELLKLWRFLLDSRTAESAVIIDHERAPGNDIVGFGLSVFVTDAFVEETRSALPPYQVQHILRRWLHGCSPILDGAQIARANSGKGLNVLVMHHGWSTDGRPNKDSSNEIKLKLFEAFLNHQAGYHIKHFQQEIYGEAEMVEVRRSGATVETDYAAHFQQKSAVFPPPPDGRRPYLMALRRDVGAGLYSPVSLLFTAPRARFSFTPGEQEVLQCALEGQTDEEIAAQACRSLWAIKKRWQGIYQRVERIDVDILANGGGDDGQIGHQRRRRLLRYVRLHREELRPGIARG
jgi:DNA-binding CsgD family transcriptional regulator